MANFLYLASQRVNVPYSAESIVVVPAAHAKYAIENLYIGDPGYPFRFGSAATDSRIDINANVLPNGDLELWDDANTPTGFTPVDITQEAVEVHGGTYSAEFAGSGTLSRTIWVPAGWAFTVEVWMFGDGSDPINAYLINQYTGKQLNSSGAWVASAAFGAQTAAAWAKTTISTGTVESYATCGYQHLIPLQLHFDNTGAGAAFVDDVAFWPHVDFVSIHGHNLRPTITPKLQSDDNAAYSSPTTRSTLTIAQPAFYDSLVTKVTDRYLRVLLEGTPYEAPELGELWFGQYKTIRRPRYGLSMPVQMPNIESRNLARKPFRRALSYYPARQLIMDFRHNSSQRTEMLEMFHRCEYGTEPCVIVPLDNEGEVYMGTWPTALSHSRISIGFFETETIPFEEYPFAKPIP